MAFAKLDATEMSNTAWRQSSDKDNGSSDEKDSRTADQDFIESGDTARISQHNESVEDDNDYPKAGKLAVIIVALCLSVFCVALDNTIISTAIPRITDQFHAIDDVGWYASAYFLCTAAFQLFFGRLYTFFSIKWVYLCAILIFEIGSAVCGAAPSSTALIVGRAIAGVGSAGVFAGAILIIGNTVPLAKRPTYLGLVGSMYGISSVIGPLLGGAFTAKVSWRWCFYINLPIGAVALFFVVVLYRPKTKQAQTLAVGWKAKLDQLDLLGLAIFLPAIVCLLLALQWGGSTYPWSNGRIIALLVLFAVLVIVFGVIQIWKKDRATLPPRVLKQRSVAAGAFFSLALGGSFYSFIYYIPIWFQAIKGASPVNSGVMNIPMVLSLVIFSVGAGALVTNFGHYTPYIYASTVLMAVGAGLLSTFTESTGSPKWIGYQVIYGAGVGLGLQQPLVAVQTVLPNEDVPTGTALIIFAQTFGGAVFVSVAQSVFTNELLQQIKTAAPTIDAEMILSLGATALRKAIPQQNLAAVLVAYNEAVIKAFYVGVAMATVSVLGSAFFEWRSVKGEALKREEQ